MKQLSGRKAATPRNNELRVFVSHCVDDKKFVFEVCDLLTPFLNGARLFLFEKRPKLDGDFLEQINDEIAKSHLALFFVGERFDKYMDFEAMSVSLQKGKLVIVIDISGRKSMKNMPESIQVHLNGRHHVFDDFTSSVPPNALRCAKRILQTLKEGADNHPVLESVKLDWTDAHWRYGLPAEPYIFSYEKDIIRFYVAKRCRECLEQGMRPDEAVELQKKYAPEVTIWTPEKIDRTLRKGIAADWPKVHRYEPITPNPFRKAMFRAGDDVVRAAALVKLDAPGEPLVFPEAGPRPDLALPAPMRRRLKAAIVVTGGIAPGINAVIDAIVQRHTEYHAAAELEERGYDLKIIGLKNGLLAIEPNTRFADHCRILKSEDTAEHATRGGSMLGTSRDEELLDPARAANRLEAIASELYHDDIDVLYVIGGDGSMKAAHALWHKVNALADERGRRSRMSVVTIPKTMDNDILWVWQSFGFLSAVEEAREIVERLHTEVRSNPRLGVVQFFGSGSGFVVSHAVLAAATGHTTLALIPEIDFSVIGVARYLKQRLWEAARSSNIPHDPAAPIDPSIPHGLIVMAETAIPVDAMECLGLKPPPAHLSALYEAVAAKLRVNVTPDELEKLTDFESNDRRVEGQTNENLRSLGIKILIEALPILIQSELLNPHLVKQPAFDQPNWSKLRMVRNEPRYLVRALEPSTSDIINGERLGLLAVDAAMAGYTDCMVSQWLTEFVIIPLELVVLGRKKIPDKGMFWNSVTDKTKQFPELVFPFVYTKRD